VGVQAAVATVRQLYTRRAGVGASFPSLGEPRAGFSRGKQHSFNPTPASVKPGGRVRWFNNGSTHTVSRG